MHGEKEPGKKSLQNLIAIPWTLTKTCNGKNVMRQEESSCRKRK